jgi:2-aminophenol/2-amino-5-chlorophenol 1,6-dioxygenase subunit alpha
MIVVGCGGFSTSTAPTTEKLAAMAVQCAADQGKNVAIVGVGGLSGGLFRTELDLSADRIVSETDDEWNQRLLRLMESGDTAGLRQVIPEFAKQARADMGFRHFHWVMGALGGNFSGARIHAYGPLYGSGAAVIEFKL